MQIDGLLTNSDNVTIDTAPAINVDELFVDDLSGLHFDQGSGHLLVLSQQSMLLAEVSHEGERISYLDLERGFNQQVEDIPQAEGVTVDAQGDLYIVSEPNLIYRFSPTP